MPTHFCSLLFSSGQISRNSVNSTYPINSFEEEASCRNRIASFRLLNIWKHDTLYWRIMSTPGSLCEPPANNIVEPLTLMALRGKVFISHAFISPVRFCEPVFSSQVWVKPRRNQYISHVEAV